MGQIISASEKTKEKQDNGETRAHSILPVPLRKNLDKRATEPVKSAIIDGWATNALEKVIGAARNDSELSLFDKRASVLIRLGNDKDEQEILKASVIGAITDETRKNPNLSKLILKENIDKQTGYGLWRSFYEKLGELGASQAIAETIREFFSKAGRAKSKKETADSTRTKISEGT